LDIRFLISLIAVINKGSIASAARSQNLTATAVSQRIRILEKQLKTSLLTREAHSAQPTQSCIELIPHIKKLIHDSRSLQSMLAPSYLSGHITLGAISTALTDFIPRILRRFKQIAPNVTFTIIPGSSSKLYEQLLNQELDGAITVNPAFTLPEHIVRTLLKKQKLLLLSQQKKNAPFKKIIQETPLILYDRESWGGHLILKWLKKQVETFQVFCELDTLETIALLVEENMGIAIVPEWNALYQCHPKLAIQVIHNAPQREVVFLSLKSSPVEKLLEQVVFSFIDD
jgi:DNA-binding transcriptional LysR family regulator